MEKPTEPLLERLDELEVRASTIGIIRRLGAQRGIPLHQVVFQAILSSEQAQFASRRNQEFMWADGSTRLPFPPPYPDNEGRGRGFLSVALNQVAARILLARSLDLNLVSDKPVPLGEVLDEAVHYENQVAQADEAGITLVLVEKLPATPPYEI